jgi:hypothetical protein
MGHYLWFLSVTNNGCHERSSAFVVFSNLLFSCIHYSIIYFDNDKFCIERCEFKAMEIHAVRTYVVIMIYCRVLNYNSIHSAFSSFHKKFLSPLSEVGTVVVAIVWKLALQLLMLSVHITNNVVSSNPTQAKCT